MVKFLGDDGKVLSADARSLLGMEEENTLVGRETISPESLRPICAFAGRADGKAVTVLPSFPQVDLTREPINGRIKCVGVFMREVFTRLMAAWIFVLAVSGWCCRPPFACAQADSAPSVSQTVACCQRCGREGHRESEPTAPCKGQSECHGVCVYVPAQKAQLDTKPVLSAIDFIAIAPPLTDSQIAAALAWEQLGDPLRFEPPLRLHLVHQVLLI